MPLTELEGVILGIVESRGSCSIYDVYKRFERSPTWGWSASKGAIYPAVARLLSREQLRVESASRGRRNSEILSITDAGLTELTEWISEIPEHMGGAPVDPIRTRVNYLAALDEAERCRFLDRAEEMTRIALAAASVVSLESEAANSWTMEATLIGVRLQIEAKLRWLQRIRSLALGTGEKS